MMKNNSIFSIALPAFIAMSIGLFPISNANGTPRPIVANGTIRTAQGDLLRGTSLHISKTYSSRCLTWGLDKNNLIKLRDQAHLNTIRLNCLDPRAVVDGRPTQAFSTIAEEAVYVDSVIANCGAVGLYVLLDYHCMGMVYDMSTWDIRNFWDFYAPRYKDKPYVMYEMMNEPYAAGPPMATGGADLATARNVDLYKNHVRKWAPNTIVTGMMEPVEVVADWGPYLRDIFGPKAGIDWTAGKDAWAFHVYAGTTAPPIIATKSSGVPIICSEFSYPEDGWTNGDLEGVHLPAQWCERNNISWMDWKSWNAADQAAMEVTVLIPDAQSKGWVWWNKVDVAGKRPVYSAPRPADLLTRPTARIQANGRMLPDQMREEKRNFQLYIFPLNSMRR